jgi:hypothetical protein
MQKHLWTVSKIIVVVIALGIGLVIGFYAFNAWIYQQKQGDGSEVTSYRGTLQGEYVCLAPERVLSAPEGCAPGLRTEVGEEYALDFQMMSQPYPTLQLGYDFRATGLITPIEMLSAEHWRNSTLEGIFSVTDSVERL